MHREVAPRAVALQTHHQGAPVQSPKPLALALAVALAIPAAVAAAPALTTTTDGPAESPAVTVARDHLAAELGAEDVAAAIVTDEHTSQHNGVTHVYLRQVVGGLEVLGADATVNVRDGEVLFTDHRLIDEVAGAVSGSRVLSPSEAVASGAIAVGADPRAVTGEPGLAYQVTERATAARLVWSFQLRSEHDWWNLAVDAETGDVLYQANWVDHEDMSRVAARTVRPEAEGAARALLEAEDPILPPETAEDGSSYRVFPMPLENPLDNGAEHQVVDNPADAIASPFGWHDRDGQEGPDSTITRGNNVNAYADSVQASFYAGHNLPVPQHNEADPLSQPDGGEGLDFDDEILSYDATPLTYRDAAVTNLFFWNNVMHDVTYRYGFDEAAGNFQETNFRDLDADGEVDGIGSDAVNAEAQDTSFVLNANFATPADGAPGRMQMFLWVDALNGNQVRAHSAQVRDGDLDAGVVAHEYGHGISNRLVGGPSNVDCLRTHDERQGEGWSDFWTYALTMRDGDDGATPRGIGNYVTYQDDYAEGEPDQFGRGGDIRSGPGIRITPYSTFKLVNPATYDTVKSAAEPHGVGYVWASMLWDLYWNLVDVHGFNANPYEHWSTGGNNLTIQLVMDGMKLVGCEPGFADARDAIIAADAALTGSEVTGVDTEGSRVTESRGENFCLIWDTFANRGLGVDAEQGDPASKTDGANGFQTHPDC